MASSMAVQDLAENIQDGSAGRQLRSKLNSILKSKVQGAVVSLGAQKNALPLLLFPTLICRVQREKTQSHDRSAMDVQRFGRH